MLDTLLSGPFAPFTVSLALLFGLLALEVALLLVGASLIGESEAEVDLDVADGPDMDLDLDLEVELDAFDVDAGEFELAVEEFEVEAPVPTEAATSPLSWLGLGKMPTLIWLASLFLSFGVTGIALQGTALSLIGTPLNVVLTSIAAAAAAIWFTGRFGALFARLLPKTESQSVSTRTLGRRRGIVTQGTARRGDPAEVRVTDRYGNTHYLRAEPMQDAGEIEQGTEVLVLRHRPTGGFRLIPM
ncbi:OB-fold-containig protein [Gymnodinialimonas hymeniacidonis]|uniref:OB-fold-containig protein n=1 Tax=Gymnodinialimonas hymeniacidonis TaxID=3126508 RepID=UPI0034C6D2F6